MANETPSLGTAQKAILVTFLVIMAAIGLANVIIGAVSMDGCGNAVMLPALLVVNGVLWALPALVLTIINCAHHETVAGLFSCLEKLFLLVVVFLIASTVYVLVNVSQAKSLDFLCTATWVPPYCLVILFADWVSLVLFAAFFCCHEPQEPEAPPMEFKHLKNLPPLVFPWNRHRVIRTY